MEAVLTREFCEETKGSGAGRPPGTDKPEPAGIVAKAPVPAGPCRMAALIGASGADRTRSIGIGRTLRLAALGPDGYKAASLGARNHGPGGENQVSSVGLGRSGGA